MSSSRIQKISNRRHAANRTNHRANESQRTSRENVESLLRQERRSLHLLSPKVMARAQEIQTLDTAFLVGKRRPLTEFCPKWKRWIVRAVFFALNWSNGDAVEVQAICTDRELAVDLANRWPSGFFVRLPINTPLPDEPCTFREQEFPRSEAAGIYERTSRAPLLSKGDIKNLKQLDEQLKDLVRSARAG